MAKKAGVNRSAAIKAYLNDHPDAKNAEVAAAVSKQLGITINPTYVSVIKNDSKTSVKKASGVDTEKLAAMFVLKNKGNVAAVLKQVKEFEPAPKSDIEVFIDTLGGKAAAEKAIAKLQESLKG